MPWRKTKAQFFSRYRIKFSFCTSWNYLELHKTIPLRKNEISINNKIPHLNRKRREQMRTKQKLSFAKFHLRLKWLLHRGCLTLAPGLFLPFASTWTNDQGLNKHGGGKRGMGNGYPETQAELARDLSPWWSYHSGICHDSIFTLNISTHTD